MTLNRSSYDRFQGSNDEPVICNDCGREVDEDEVNEDHDVALCPECAFRRVDEEQP